MCTRSLACVALLGSALCAQIDVGKAAKYYEYKPGEAIAAGAYPTLAIDDLRKLTQYSKLTIKDASVLIADDQYVRRIEPHSQDKELLVVTTDAFKWTTLKSGWIDRTRFPKSEALRYGFIWIKHATQESPNGKPWLKDLVLLPYDKKTGKLTAPWPFGERLYESRWKEEPEWESPWTTPFFLKAADPRPRRMKLPDETKSVLGTFDAGKASYLVIDTFGGYSWWGKVAWTEFFPLRDKTKAVVDAFHGAAAKSKGKTRPIVKPWRLPRQGRAAMVEVLGTTADEAGKLLGQIPALLKIRAQSEKPDGWEDLLELEETQPIPTVESRIKDLATLENLLLWVRDLTDRNNGPSAFSDWSLPLKDLVVSNEQGHVTSARTARYVFRRLGFPCVLQGYVTASTEAYPGLSLHVYIPSQGVSWIIRLGPGWSDVLVRPTCAELWDLPQASPPPPSRRGLPIFDCVLGAGEKTQGPRWPPVPPKK